MRQLDFYFVDVFTREPLAGNPLAVVDDADALDAETMRRIAREFNQSETTFVMRATRPDADRLVTLVRALDGQGCYVFSLDPIDPAATAHARFFNPAVGIAEDPATGSAAGPLGSYLTARGLVAEGVAIVVEQGHLAGRPSRIEVRVRGDQVQVLGSAVVVARGRLRVG